MIRNEIRKCRDSHLLSSLFFVSRRRRFLEFLFPSTLFLTNLGKWKMLLFCVEGKVGVNLSWNCLVNGKIIVKHFHISFLERNLIQMYFLLGFTYMFSAIISQPIHELSVYCNRDFIVSDKKEQSRNKNQWSKGQTPLILYFM